MNYSAETLPPLPPARTIAFDDAINISGYNAADMRQYALSAIADYIARGGIQSGIGARLRAAMAALNSPSASSALAQGATTVSPSTASGAAG